MAYQHGVYECDVCKADFPSTKPPTIQGTGLFGSHEYWHFTLCSHCADQFGRLYDSLRAAGRAVRQLNETDGCDAHEKASPRDPQDAYLEGFQRGRNLVWERLRQILAETGDAAP